MIDDPMSDRFGVLFDVHVGEPNYIPAQIVERSLSGEIRVRGLIVIATVDFHHQLLAEACEIDDPTFDGMLPTKFEAANLLGS